MEVHEIVDGSTSTHIGNPVGADRKGASRVSLPSRPSIYSRVVEELGHAICEGSIAPGSVLTVEEIEASTGASRSVVRESARVLASLGLLRPTKRVGMVILDEAEWNLFDGQVIRWRLESAHRQRQIRELIEIRLAVEPEAARMAALRASPEICGAIVSAAGDLWATGVSGSNADFAEQDGHFHRLVLEASGNTMYARLADVINESLRDRALVQLHDTPVDRADVQLHVDLAGFIQRGDGDAAARCARAIIMRANGWAD